MFKNIWVIQISVLILDIKNIIVLFENRNVLIYYINKRGIFLKYREI